jgi:hypothetical protein
MHHYGNDGKQDEQMDEEAGEMETQEQAQPQNHEYNCQDEKHCDPSFPIPRWPRDWPAGTEL